MKESKRALRRHHVQRIKLLVLEQVKAVFPRTPEIWSSQVICRYRNRAPCSCWMCGNPRRHAYRATAKVTRHEQIQMLRDAEQRTEAVLVLDD